jgi:hypothetical protein
MATPVEPETTRPSGARPAGHFVAVQPSVTDVHLSQEPTMSQSKNQKATLPDLPVGAAEDIRGGTGFNALIAAQQAKAQLMDEAAADLARKAKPATKRPR